MSKQFDLLSDDECTCSQCKTPVNCKTERDLNKIKPRKTVGEKLRDIYRGWRP